MPDDDMLDTNDELDEEDLDDEETEDDDFGPIEEDEETF